MSYLAQADGWRAVGVADPLHPMGVISATWALGDYAGPIAADATIARRYSVRSYLRTKYVGY